MPNKPHIEVGGSALIAFVTLAPNRVGIVRFGLKEALTALKRVYKVKKTPYLYSAKNFPPYPMWDFTTPPPLPCRHNILVVSYGIVAPNKQTPLWG